jgi:hypothetical protein
MEEVHYGGEVPHWAVVPMKKKKKKKLWLFYLKTAMFLSVYFLSRRNIKLEA